jgi:hypothetical protein
VALHALDDIDDAFVATRTFLWPPDRTRWAKLALVVLFVGGPGVGLNAGQVNLPAGGGPTPGPGDPAPPALPVDAGRLLVAAGVVVVAAVLLVLAFAFVGSVMEFVLVEALRRESVRVRAYWGARWRQGARLFAFRLVVGLVGVGAAVFLAGLVVLPVATGGGAGALGVVAALLLLPVFVVLAVLLGLVDGFTTVFVVPVMVSLDCGVLDGWRRLWPTLTGQPGQYLVYAVVSVVLSVGGGLLVALAAGVALVVLLVPFGLLAALGVGLLAVFEPLGVGVLGLTVVVGGLVALAVLALAQVPVVTYLRYYALFVLGDVDPELDLVAERRATVRGSTAEPD